MSLLGNLVTQVAKNALGNNDSAANQPQASSAGQSGGLSDGLGGMLGGMLGGAVGGQSTSNQNNNQFGVDDILGSVLGGGGSNVGAGGLGAVLGSVLGAKKGGGKGMLIAALLPMVLSWIQRNGGLSGALSQLNNLGFAQQAQSWLSTQSSNENVDPNQIEKLFDKSEISQAAQQTGTDETQVRQGLAELLPEVIDHLTPEGGLDREQEANSEISEILSQFASSVK